MRIITPPIDLESYRNRWPWYLKPRPSDHDITAAVICRVAYMRRKFPATPHDMVWCTEHDPALGAFLEDIDARNAWIELREERKGLRGMAYGPLIADPMPETSQRILDGEELATYSRALPRMRDLGELILEEREEAKLKPTPAPESKGEGGGGGGKKAKASTAATPEQETTEDADLILTMEEIEELTRKYTP